MAPPPAERRPPAANGGATGRETVTHRDGGGLEGGPGSRGRQGPTVTVQAPTTLTWPLTASAATSSAGARERRLGFGRRVECLGFRVSWPCVNHCESKSCAGDPPQCSSVVRVTSPGARAASLSLDIAGRRPEPRPVAVSRLTRNLNRCPSPSLRLDSDGHWHHRHRRGPRH